MLEFVYFIGFILFYLFSLYVAHWLIIMLNEYFNYKKYFKSNIKIGDIYLSKINKEMYRVTDIKGNYIYYTFNEYKSDHPRHKTHFIFFINEFIYDI